MTKLKTPTRPRLVAEAPLDQEGRIKFNGEEIVKYDAASKKGEVFIFARIGDPYEGITDKTFADAMQRLGNVDEMIVYINSPGGDVTTGNTIYNLLKAHRAKKVIKVVGVAA